MPLIIFLHRQPIFPIIIMSPAFRSLILMLRRRVRRPPLTLAGHFLRDLRAHGIVLILPHPSIPIIPMCLTPVAVDDTAGHPFPAAARTHEVPFPRVVDLTSHEHVAGLLAKRAGLPMVFLCGGGLLGHVTPQ